MQNPQPTIFISSIISEFYDLRGALKYFLGKSGFRILMSEEPDFGADCGLDSLDNCKNQIEKSDYYLLIIGNSPGTIFNIDGKDTSVTFEEFKHYINLVKAGRKMNFMAFVRQQAWDNFQAKNIDKIHELQIDFINELLTNSLFEDKKIGRWRYTFDKFSDIIATLETNQNGLFLEATRKSALYKTYIKREINELYKFFLEKNNDTGTITSIVDLVNLPDLPNLHLINYSPLNRDLASRIVAFLVITARRETLLRKINRVFNYISQGEFARFDPIEEKYALPEYIKLAVQSLEMLERIFDNANSNSIYKDLRTRRMDEFQINRMEYFMVKSAFGDLKIAILKLSNLMKCFNENWYDIEQRDDSFYEYRGGTTNVTDDEAISYAERIFEE